MSEISNVLVTGGCGFLGKHVVQRLLALGASVTILDNLSLGGAIVPLDAATLAVGDIADPTFVSDVARSQPFSHVVHLAALHYIPKCDAEPKLAFMTNVVGTRNVIAACSHIPSLRTLVHASTMAVYAPSSEPHAESSSCVPIDVYGWSKLITEDLVRGGGERSFDRVCLRLSNLVGPGETNPHLFPEIASQIQSGATRIEVGNLTPRRNYVHAAEVATLVISALKHQWNGFDIVNIGSEEEYSVFEVLEKFRNLAPSPVEFVSSPARQRQVDRPRLQPNLEKMRHLLGDTNRTVDDAIRELLAERAATLHAA